MKPQDNNTWSVQVIDMFNYMDPEDGERLVQGFESSEAAIEYARRRTRDSLEELRSSSADAADLRSRWYMFGEDCVANGTGYWGSSELDRFIANPATPEEADWASLEPNPQLRALLMSVEKREGEPS
jgi:hypothetical protein